MTFVPELILEKLATMLFTVIFTSSAWKIAAILNSEVFIFAFDLNMAES